MRQKGFLLVRGNGCQIHHVVWRNKCEPTPCSEKAVMRNSLVIAVQLPLLDCFRHFLRPVNVVDLGELQQSMAGRLVVPSSCVRKRFLVNFPGAFSQNLTPAAFYRF